MTSHEKKDSAIAAALTMGVVIALLLLLIFGKLNFDREALAAASIPEITPPEELFIEPELIPEAGDHEEDLNDNAAPQAQGKPEPAPEPAPEKIVRDENPKPAPPVEKPVVQKQESPVKATTPSKRDQEEKKAKDAVAGKFSPRNGMAEGKFDGAGTGTAGVGVTGKLAGRKFMGCPKPDVTLTHKVVVRVELTVDAEGNVTEVRGASAVSGRPDAGIIAKCKAAAKGARWAPKKGAAPTPGSITFTITPKK
ncbi:MAG: hypothetical protein K2O24_08620 [Muribaculaceae bacterium]|nr:hypothetical protein [Muribaculaceae bacterium]